MVIMPALPNHRHQQRDLAAAIHRKNLRGEMLIPHLNQLNKVEPEQRLVLSGDIEPNPGPVS